MRTSSEIAEAVVSDFFEAHRDAIAAAVVARLSAPKIVEACEEKLFEACMAGLPNHRDGIRQSLVASGLNVEIAFEAASAYRQSADEAGEMQDVLLGDVHKRVEDAFRRKIGDMVGRNEFRRLFAGGPA